MKNMNYVNSVMLSGKIANEIVLETDEENNLTFSQISIKGENEEVINITVFDEVAKEIYKHHQMDDIISVKGKIKNTTRVIFQDEVPIEVPYYEVRAEEIYAVPLSIVQDTGAVKEHTFRQKLSPDKSYLY